MSTLPFDDPTRTGATVFLNVLGNGDAAESSGLGISIDKSMGNLIDSRLSYDFIDGEDSNPLTRRHNINWTGSLSLPTDYREGSVVGEILKNVGLFTTLRLRSGLQYTQVVNEGNGQVGPPNIGGLPAGGINDETTPWNASFDLRLTKSFKVGNGLDLQAFVDWRNPFNIENGSTLFLETGAAVNSLFRMQTLSSTLRDSQLDGDSQVDDFDIRSESPDNPFNVFMLLRAEQRFGNGDGIFTVEEQETAFGQVYENDFGVNSRFNTSDQLMRLGVRIAF